MLIRDERNEEFGIKGGVGGHGDDLTVTWILNDDDSGMFLLFEKFVAVFLKGGIEGEFDVFLLRQERVVSFLKTCFSDKSIGFVGVFPSNVSGEMTDGFAERIATVSVFAYGDGFVFAVEKGAAVVFFFWLILASFFCEFYPIPVCDEARFFKAWGHRLDDFFGSDFVKFGELNGITTVA